MAGEEARRFSPLQKQHEANEEIPAWKFGSDGKQRCGPCLWICTERHAVRSSVGATKAPKLNRKLVVVRLYIVYHQIF